MKKIAVLLLAALAALSLSACAKTNEGSAAPAVTDPPAMSAAPESTPGETVPEQEIDYAEAIVGTWQLNREVTLARLSNSAKEGFLNALNEGYDLSLVLNADGTGCMTVHRNGSVYVDELTYKIENGMLFMQYETELSAYQFELNNDRLYLWTRGNPFVLDRAEG